MAAARGAMRRKMKEEKERKEKEEEALDGGKKKKKGSFRNSFKKDKKDKDQKPPKTKEQIDRALAKAKGIEMPPPEKPKKSLADILSELKKDKDKAEGKVQSPDEEPLMVKNAGKLTPSQGTPNIEQSKKSGANVVARDSMKSNKSDVFLSPSPNLNSRNNSTGHVKKSPSPMIRVNNSYAQPQRSSSLDHRDLIPQRERDLDNQSVQRSQSQRVERNHSNRSQNQPTSRQQVQRNESQKSYYSHGSGGFSYNEDHDVDDWTPREPEIRSRFDSFVDDDDDFVQQGNKNKRSNCKFLNYHCFILMPIFFLFFCIVLENIT